eukprot:gene5048-5705_t
MTETTTATATQTAQQLSSLHHHQVATAYSIEFMQQIRLEKAVESGNHNELKLILQQESSSAALDLNAMNSEGLSPFHKCIMGGNLDCLKLLVRHGADIKLATRDGWSPMHLATWKGHRKILLYLLTHNSS